MFVNLNGPPLKLWNPHDYVKSWLQSHRSAVDNKSKKLHNRDSVEQDYRHSLWKMLWTSICISSSSSIIKRFSGAVYLNWLITEYSLKFTKLLSLNLMFQNFDYRVLDLFHILSLQNFFSTAITGSPDVWFSAQNAPETVWRPGSARTRWGLNTPPDPLRFKGIVADPGGANPAMLPPSGLDICFGPLSEKNCDPDILQTTQIWHTNCCQLLGASPPIYQSCLLSYGNALVDPVGGGINYSSLPLSNWTKNLNYINTVHWHYIEWI